MLLTKKFCVLFSVMFVSLQSAVHSQYNNSRLIPGKQYTGWTTQRNAQAEYNNQYISQNQNHQQVNQNSSVPYNYYGFPKMGMNGVRMTNKLPGYGKMQNDYQVSDSEKGFYILLSYLMGTDKGKGITSEVQNPDMPGNWIGRPLGKTSAFSLGAGTFLSGTLRVEFAYSAYSGLKYYNKAVETYGNPDEEDDPGPIDYKVSESEGISSNNISVSFYYSLKDVIGDFLGGMFMPYVGGGVGMAYNKLGSYTLEFPGNIKDFPDSCRGDDKNPKPYDPSDPNDSKICGEVMSDGTARYIGSITPAFSIGLEAGVTMQIQEKIAIDFFYKNNKLGAISTSGEAATVQPAYDVHLSDDPTAGHVPSGYEFYESVSDDVTAFYYYKDDVTKLKKSRKESGDINTWEMGIKLRAYF